MKKKILRSLSICAVTVLSCLKADIPASVVMIVTAAGIGPLAALAISYIGQSVDAAVAYFGNHDIGVFIMVLLKAAAIAFASAICSIISNHAKTRVQCASELKMKTVILNTSEKVDYLTFISGEHQKNFSLAQQNLGENVMFLLYGLLDMVKTIFSVISFVVLLDIYGGVTALVSCSIVIAINCFTASKNNKKRWELLLSNDQTERKLQMLTSYYYDRTYAAEMLLFDDKPYIDDLYDKTANELVNSKTALIDKTNQNRVLSYCLTGAVSAAAIVMVIFGGAVSTAGTVTIVINAVLGIAKAGAGIGKVFGMVNMSARSLSMLDAYQKQYSVPNAAPAEDADPMETSSLIRVRNLHFSFDETEVLRGIDLDIKKGEAVAFVGENGAGKTTLANLLLGLYPCTKGSISIFGKDPYDARNARQPLTAAVSQLFGRYDALTFEDNICFGNPLNREGLEAFDDLFKSLDYSAIAGNEYGGKNLSGGEWQKIAIARVLNATAQLVILDEPTAALDPMSEARIFSDLMQHLHDQTCIFITHRLGAARQADRICFMKDGRIAEIGTHEELMQKRGGYYALFTAQAQWYHTTPKGGEAQC